MLPAEFIFVAAGLRLIGGASYIRAVVRGTARPYPLSWLLWGIIPMIVFFAELSEGVGLRSLVTLAIAVTPLLVFAIAMVKNPKLLKFDAFNILCLLFALAGIWLWAVTDNPIVAIVVAILADIFAAIPTFRKVIKEPKSENPPTFLFSISAMVITFLTITEWTFATYAFPAYVISINAFLFSLTQRRVPKKKRGRKKKR